MSTLKPRRKRSNMRTEEAQKEIASFFKRVIRMGCTSDPSIFRHPCGDKPALGLEHINIQFMMEGTYGNESLFEAVRVLGEHKLPKKKTQ